MHTEKSEEGLTLAETLVGIAIIAIVFTSLASLFSLGIESVQKSKARTIATTVGQREMETIRNLPFDDIGTTTGWPSGTLVAQKTVTESGVELTILTTIQFVDDPFDGLVTDSETPDVFPWDYKKVEVEVQSPDFQNIPPVLLTSHFAPDGIESADNRGTLLVHVIDANGAPVQGASVDVENSGVAPAVDAAQLTNVHGDVFFYALEPDVQGYHITASKEGYSTDGTYTADTDPLSPTYNPNPDPADATIVIGEVTEITLAIDRLSSIDVSTVSGAEVSEWRVNTDDSSEDQVDPIVLAKNDSQAVFGWKDHRNNKWNSYAQQATTTTGDAEWGDVQIDPQAKQGGTTAALSSSGDIFVGWHDDRNGNQDAYLKKLDASGALVWDGPKKIDTSAESADQTDITITGDSSGGCAIAWRDARMDAGDIYFHRCDTDGVFTLATDVRVDDGPVSTTQSAPRIALDPTSDSDEFYVLWQDTRSDAGDIYLHRIDANGYPVWPSSIVVHSGGVGATQSNAELDVLSTGEAVVVWEDTRPGTTTGIYYQKVQQDGTLALEEDARIGHSQQDNSQQTPDLTVLSDDRVAVVWIDTDGADPNVYATIINNDGTESWATDFLANRDNAGAEQSSPSISAGSNGASETITVGWADLRNSDWDIYASNLESSYVPVPVPNVPFQLRLNKAIGSAPHPTPPPDTLTIYKFESSYTTDENGFLSIPNLEWGNYTLIPDEPYTEVLTIPTQPVFLEPSTSLSVEMSIDTP